MPATGLTFAAEVDAWVRQTQKRSLLVFRESAKDVVGLMQRTVDEGGSMPVKTGFLRAGLIASNSGMPLAVRENPNPDVKFPYDAGPINLVIAGTEAGATLYVGYTANYAIHMEYGTKHIAPRAFVRTAAAQWQQIVNRNIMKAKNIELGGFARLT